MSILQRKVPRKTPLTSKIMETLLQDRADLKPQTSVPRPPKTPRQYTPPSPTTLKVSSVLQPSPVGTQATYNEEFSKKLQASPVANLLMSPLRLDKLTRTKLPKDLMVTMGFTSSIDEVGNKKIKLEPQSLSKTSGSKGYIFCDKKSFEALSLKKRWSGIASQFIATSNKIESESFLKPLKNANKTKQGETSDYEKSSVYFYYDTALPETIPNMLVNQMIELAHNTIIRHHMVRLGLPVQNEYYFTLTWNPETKNEDSHCTDVVFVPSILSPEHSEALYNAMAVSVKTLPANQSANIPSRIGVPLQNLLRKYKFYSPQ